MTDDLNQRSQPEPYNSGSTASEQIVTLKLPAELARLIQVRSQQFGKSPAEVILALLHAALNPADAERAGVSDGQTLEAIQKRLAALEAMIPRLVQLEGKWMAF